MIVNDGHNVKCNILECIYSDSGFCKYLGESNLKPNDKEKCHMYKNGLL